MNPPGRGYGMSITLKAESNQFDEAKNGSGFKREKKKKKKRETKRQMAKFSLKLSLESSQSDE